MDTYAETHTYIEIVTRKGTHMHAQRLLKYQGSLEIMWRNY